jgi:hypothetical protein
MRTSQRNALPKLTKRENDLLRRALDKAATPEEARTAARVFIESLRARGINAYDFIPPERSGPPPRQPEASAPPPPQRPTQEDFYRQAAADARHAMSQHWMH